MKISEITIKLTPSTNENRSERILIRNENKMWSADVGGFFPSEIDLIKNIQEVIHKFNSVN